MRDRRYEQEGKYHQKKPTTQATERGVVIVKVFKDVQQYFRESEFIVDPAYRQRGIDWGAIQRDLHSEISGLAEHYERPLSYKEVFDCIKDKIGFFYIKKSWR